MLGEIGFLSKLIESKLCIQKDFIKMKERMRMKIIFILFLCSIKRNKKGGDKGGIC